MPDPSPLEKGLLVGVSALLTVLFLAMPAWRGMPQAAAVASYPIAADAFDARLTAMITRFQVGEQGDLPVVRPPPGDVYLTAERWRFTPALELEAGGSYRLHVSSRDTMHGVVIAGREALLTPGTAAVLPLTAGGPGPVPTVCSEYCGLEHNKMKGAITVVEKGAIIEKGKTP